MQITKEIIDNIKVGQYSKATFEFQEILKQKYQEIKDNFIKSLKDE